VVVPVGLEAAVRGLTGQSVCAGGQALELAQGTVASLAANLRSESQRANIETCVDAVFACADELTSFVLGDASSANEAPALAEVAGVTPWDADAAPRTQLKTAGILHGLAGGGAAALLVSRSALPAAADVVDLVHYAWKQTDIARLRLVRLAP